MKTYDRLYTLRDLPWNLRDVVHRMLGGEIVYGFELELMADRVSQ